VTIGGFPGVPIGIDACFSTNCPNSAKEILTWIVKIVHVKDSNWKPVKSYIPTSRKLKKSKKSELGEEIDLINSEEPVEIVPEPKKRSAAQVIPPTILEPVVEVPAIPRPPDHGLGLHGNWMAPPAESAVQAGQDLLGQIIKTLIQAHEDAVIKELREQWTSVIKEQIRQEILTGIADRVEDIQAARQAGSPGPQVSDRIRNAVASHLNQNRQGQ
jgi:hypothetical protein